MQMEGGKLRHGVQELGAENQPAVTAPPGPYLGRDPQGGRSPHPVISDAFPLFAAPSLKKELGPSLQTAKPGCIPSPFFPEQCKIGMVHRLPQEKWGYPDTPAFSHTVHRVQRTSSSATSPGSEQSEVSPVSRPSVT